MLRYTEHGWCNVEIGDFVGSASYLMDVPFNCLNSFIAYFTKGNDINSIAIAFDEEGTEFTVVSNIDSTFIIVERYEIPVLEYFNNINIKQLANELIEDLERDFNDWVNWECCGEYEPQKGRAEELKFGIEKLKQLIKDF